MTKQEAYQELCEMIDDLDQHISRTRTFAREHKLDFDLNRSQSYDTVDPETNIPYKFDAYGEEDRQGSMGRGMGQSNL